MFSKTSFNFSISNFQEVEEEEDDNQVQDKEDNEDRNNDNDNGFSDETLECKDCGYDFVFTSGEQEFYQQKGFENKPARCKACKDAKKQRIEGGGNDRRGGDRRDDRRGDDRRGGGGGGG
jgi:hypothetical protein